MLDRSCAGKGRGIVAKLRVFDCGLPFLPGKGADDGPRCVVVGLVLTGGLSEPLKVSEEDIHFRNVILA